MNYEEMSKPELCALVAKEWFDDVISYGSNCDGSIYLNRESEKRLVDFDPIDNPSDAWPIIVENEMKIDPRRSSPKLDWMVSRDDQVYSVDKNPLKAACICFLKMKDAEK